MSVGNFNIDVLESVSGVRLSALASGIKLNKSLDLTLIEVVNNASLSCVFTLNKFCAEPVRWSKASMKAGKGIRFLLINSGNANAGVGDVGRHALKKCVEALASQSGCDEQQILVFSTGVIGQPLPYDCITKNIERSISTLIPNGWNDAAKAIMTTDTFSKGLSKTCEINGKSFTLTGITKGSGMVKPNMATVLTFVATDAVIPNDVLQNMLKESIDESFNCITVDGDTSTNDSCVLIATNEGQYEWEPSNIDQVDDFQECLNGFFLELAQLLVKDGEGATKFVEVHVYGGVEKAHCKAVAYKISESPLVKTALYASDANWGRILAAVGNADVEIDVDRVDIYIGDVQIVSQGGLAESYTEDEGMRVMSKDEITIRVNLNQSDKEASVWTTDLSPEYISINADYRS
jgi:glutamate N-acetyltransferase / amino-acid N-acetyltransferase